MTVDEAIALARSHAAEGRAADARTLFEQVLAQFPNSGPAADGLRALELNVSADDLAELDHGLATVDALLTSGQPIKAREVATALSDRFSATSNVFFELGRAEAALGAGERAVTAFERAVQLAPRNAEAVKTLGDLYRGVHRLDDAIAAFEKALALDPAFLMAWNNLGVTLMSVARFHKAEACFHKILELDPTNLSALNNLSVVGHDTGNHQYCITYARKALEIDPTYVSAWNNLGNAQMGLNQYGDAVESYGKALELNPKDFEIRSKMMLCMSRTCDWEPLEKQKQIVLEHLESTPLTGAPPNPWAWLGIFDRPDVHKKIALAAGVNLRNRTDLGPIAPRPASGKIRVGYFSADYHDHPITHVIGELYELHDRENFEIHAFSFGPDRDPEFRNRIVNGVDKFHNVRECSDKEIAALARAEGIDIAVDLNGHTANKRSAIFAYRAAPVQVNYLGFPSTLGMENIDYVIADKVVIPPEEQVNYTEAVAYVPNSFMVSDSTKPVSETTPPRAHFSLPEDGIVFCCFNNSYKITAEVFDIWMRLMTRVEGSVLWLFRSNKDVDDRLRRAAEERGVAASRLIFAERVDSHADHLARYRNADLFLDTMPYNAHSTAGDSLWMGVPIVTRMGQSFAARVAGSMLTALDVPELITTTAEAYEDLAYRLATDHEFRKSIADKVKRNAKTSPLFDTRKFARDIEGLYARMHERASEGLKPEAMAVEIPGAR